jgi:hypothetical protein
LELRRRAPPNKNAIACQIARRMVEVEGLARMGRFGGSEFCFAVLFRVGSKGKIFVPSPWWRGVVECDW